MRLHAALAALLLPAFLLFQVPAGAQNRTPAQLRLLVVDQNNIVLPSASVTLFTLDGNPGVTVKADAKGVAVFPATAVGMAEIVARHPGHAPYIDKTTLKAGNNAQTITLRRQAESVENGSAS